MKNFLFPLISISAFFLNACGAGILIGSGHLQQESRQVQNFDQISLSIAARVLLTQADSESLEISAEENLLPYIHSKVENGVLVLYLEPEFASLQPTEEILITVSAKSIEALTVNGSGKIESEKLNSKNIKLTVNGSGTIDINQLEAEQISASLSGSGEIRLGTAQAQNINLRIDGNGKYVLSGKTSTAGLLINGSGRIQAQNLECQTAQTEINGSGTITVWTSEQLNASITGSGRIVYRGSGKVSKTIIGSGNISPE